MHPSIDTIEQFRLAVLKKAAYGVRTQICHLNHACEATVDEERGLDELANVASPSVLRARASSVEVTHHVGQPRAGCLIIVGNQKTQFVGACRFEKVMESANDLREGLFERRG